MIHGFLKTAAATPVCTVADCGENTANILSLIQSAAADGVRLVVFPELCVTGYTCGDLFSQDLLGRVAESAVRLIAEKTKDLAITSVVGFPFQFRNARYNCAAVIAGGKIRGIVPKTNIPNYGEFYETRHFAPAPAETAMIPAGIFGSCEVPFGTKLLFCDERDEEIAFAVEICEDLWVPNPPSSAHSAAGALVVANLSASDETVGKKEYRKNLAASQSGRCVGGYIYADAGPGESTTDMVFAGHCLIAEYGSILAESPRFEHGLVKTEIDLGRLLYERRRMNTYPKNEDSGYLRVSMPLVPSGQSASQGQSPRALLRKIDPRPFVPSSRSNLTERCEEVFSIQTAGLMKRLSHTGSKSAVIGVSGGLDSTLALLVTVRSFDRLGLPRTGIRTITMPGFGTTGRTRSNALKLAELLGTATEEIKIHKAVNQHFLDIGQNPETRDITYENSQARERTQILMDKANMLGALVIGTGDLSELALGWATYNGDHMSMYGVNASIPKTLVRHLVAWCADNPELLLERGTPNAAGSEADTETLRKKNAKKLAATLQSILDTPVSPELLPAEDGEISQKTEHIVGPYELHDFFLYHLVRWGASPAKILYLAENAFSGDAGEEAESSGRSVYAREEILKWMKVFYRRFFSQQFKRSCLPDGPKVGSVTLSPRSDWRMPSDASAALWLKELETLG
ncbi:MAG TPA: NAD(+) synthase [Treponemataceae bacterium]|nr:NAD(+) synthase [Treponemataceae bacterium]